MNTAQLRPAGTVTAEELGRVHLIGVGGVGMSGLARLLLTRGIPVSGSELREWPALAGLRALGGTIHMTHDAANLDGVDTVVYSTAIPADHLELAEARRRGLRVLHRSEALAAAMTGRRTVAVAGTHGKTTTTSMVTLILQHANQDPSFVIGGEISEAGSNAHHGSGEYFVAEADESDRSFLLYRPYVSIITNIDEDHLNTYGDYAGLAAAFTEFARLTDPDGFVVTCADDPGTRQLAETLRGEGRRVFTYGTAADADLRLTDVASSVHGVRYRAVLDGEPLGEIRLPVPGRHIGLNSASAVLTALRLGLGLEPVTAALGSFPGVRRRFERKGTAAGVQVYDEYAYHPTSMTAALETLREVAESTRAAAGAVPGMSAGPAGGVSGGPRGEAPDGGSVGVPGGELGGARDGGLDGALDGGSGGAGRAAGRLLVVFQPYRVYRTRDLRDQLAAALAIADEVVVLEVFGPGETRQPGDGGLALTEAIGLPPERKVFLPSWEDVPAEIVRRARPGDVVVTMGAPPISLMGDELLAALREHAAAGPPASSAPEGGPAGGAVPVRGAGAGGTAVGAG